MVCRSTPGNSAITTIARLQSGLPDEVMLSLFHEVRSDAPREAPAPDRAETHRFIAGQAAHVTYGLNASEARRRSILTRLGRAESAPTPDGATYYAWQQIRDRARTAHAALEAHFTEIAEQRGCTVDEVRQRFGALIDEHVAAGRNAGNAPENPAFGTANIPRHPATRYALAVLHHAPTGTPLPDVASEQALIRARTAAEARAGAVAQCTTCGQFTGDDHTCAPVSREDLSAALRIARTATSPVRPNHIGNVTVVEEDAPTPDMTLDESQAENAPPENPIYRAAREQRARRASERLEEERRREAERAEREVREARERAAADRASTDRVVRARQRTAVRTYTAGENAVQMTNRSQVLADVRAAGLNTPTPIDTVRAQYRDVWGSHTVTGEVDVTATSARSRRGQDRLTVSDAITGTEANGQPLRTLRCTCPDYRQRYDCTHVRQTLEAVAATLNDRDAVAVPTALAVEATRDALQEDYDGALAAQQQARADFAENATGVSYAENMDSFQSAWDEAKARINAGENALPYMTENATGGLGARVGGRSFGIEIEVDFPDSMTYEEKTLVAREMYEAGLARGPQVRPWHWANRGGGGYSDDPGSWAVEFDRTVDDVQGRRGCEIVSPILYDEPQTWENLKKVCEIVQRHGGRATPRTGLHINIGASDFDHTVENHNRLLGLSQAYEDQLVRVSHNPQSGPTHRGRTFCTPSQIPAGGYRRIRHAQIDNGHRSMVNLDHVPAEGDPIVASTRVEVRIFDGAVDPGRIQTNVKVALGLVNAATRGVEVPEQTEPAGTHRARNSGANGRARRLSGQEWVDDTATFRRFADTLFSRDEDKRQLVHAFAATRWQRQ